MHRFVEEVMQKSVVSVTPETAVRTLLKLLVREQISGVPVVADGGEIVGVVSTTDVVRLGAGEKELNAAPLVWEPLILPNEDFDDEFTANYFLDSEAFRYPTENQTDALPEAVFDGFTVADIMTPAAFTVGPRETVQDVGKFLLKGRIHRALVVEDGQLLGIVTAFDLLRAFVEE